MSIEKPKISKYLIEIGNKIVGQQEGKGDRGNKFKGLKLLESEYMNICKINLDIHWIGFNNIQTIGNFEYIIEI